MKLLYMFFKLLLFLTLFCQNLLFSTSISLQLKPAPERAQKMVKQDLINQKLERLSKKYPAKMERKLLKNNFKKFLPKLSGFIAIYGGYVDYSNVDGSISFPLLHKKPKTYIVITPKVELVKVYAQTSSHRNIVPDAPVKIYKLEKIKEEIVDEEEDKKEADNKETEKKEKKEAEPEKKFMNYWKIEEIEKPEHKRLSSISIVILTKPKNIVVPTGAFITSDSPNLVLPDVYVVGNTDNYKSVMNFLDIRQFFEQVDSQTQHKEAVVQKIISNK